MDNILERFIYILSGLVLLLTLYYAYIDITSPHKKTVKKNNSPIKVPSAHKSQYKKKVMYNDYYKDPDLIRSDEVFDDYIPTEEDIKAYREQKEEQ